MEVLKWGTSSRWSFGPNYAWEVIGTMTMEDAPRFISEKWEICFIGKNLFGATPSSLFDRLFLRLCGLLFLINKNAQIFKGS